MRTSQAGIDLIKQFEGLYLAAYLCPAGKWTIGYGHTDAAGAPGVYRGLRIGAGDAEEILRDDLQGVEAAVIDAVNVDLTQGQFDALVSFTFNLGAGALAKSTLLKRINEGRMDAVPAEFMKWTKARVNGELVDLPGLVKRRRAEAKLWRGLDDDAAEDPQEGRATPEAPAPSKTMSQSKIGSGAVVSGGAATIGLGSEIADQMNSAGSLLGAIHRVIDKPTFWVLLLVIAAGAGIWWWRRQHLREEAA